MVQNCDASRLLQKITLSCELSNIVLKFYSYYTRFTPGKLQLRTNGANFGVKVSHKRI